jgi:hypothetical protein
MALFPGSETAVFRPNRRYTDPADVPVALTQGGAGYSVLHLPPAVPAAEGKYPLDSALEYLTKNQPLITPEWTAWKAQPHSPKLAGAWLVSAYQAGKGRIYGQMTVAAGPTPADFVTTTVLHYPDGQVVNRTGKGVLYTGYSWRGHSTSSPSENKTDPASATQNVLLALPQHQFTVVALDGNPVPNPRAVSTVSIAVAKRVDAIVEMNAPGVWIFGSKNDAERACGLGLTIEYAGCTGPAAWTGSDENDWGYTKFGRRAVAVTPDQTFPMVFEKVAGTGGVLDRWTINGKSYPEISPLQVEKASATVCPS